MAYNDIHQVIDNDYITFAKTLIFPFSTWCYVFQFERCKYLIHLRLPVDTRSLW